MKGARLFERRESEWEEVDGQEKAMNKQSGDVGQYSVRYKSHEVAS